MDSTILDDSLQHVGGSTPAAAPLAARAETLADQTQDITLPWPATRYFDLGFMPHSIIPPNAEISPYSKSLSRKVGKHNDSRGKVPGFRDADGYRSFNWRVETRTRAQLEASDRDGDGVGLRLGRQSDGTYLLAIDADTIDRGRAVACRDAIDEQFGRVPVRIGRSPKALYLFRVTRPLSYMTVDMPEGDRVELLIESQCVVEGTHPKTQRPYEWPRGRLPALEDMPLHEPEEILRLLGAIANKVPGATLSIDDIAPDGTLIEYDEKPRPSRRAPNEGVLIKTLRQIPNSHDFIPTRNGLVALGNNLKAALPDDEERARELFQEKAAEYTGPNGETNDPEEMDEIFASLRPTRCGGFQTLLRMACKAAGPEQQNLVVAEVYFEGPDELAAAEAEETAFRASGRLMERTFLHDMLDAAAVPTPRPERFAFESFTEMASTALTGPSPYVIKDLLNKGAFGLMYGPSNVGKSFVALSLAYHVAAGLAWGGMKVKPGAVVYVAAEGGSGSRKRVLALMKQHGPADVNLRFLLSNIDLRRPDADLTPLLQALKALGYPIALLVIDTLSRVMAGGDENSSIDMGALVKNIDKIREETGATVLVIHHSGRDVSRGARGHSLLRAAVDTEIEIADQQIVVTKQRDIDTSWSSAFVLDVVTLGTDEDGAPITSCTVRLVDKDQKPSGQATPSEQAILDALEHVLSGEPSRGAKAAEVLGYLKGTDRRSTLDGVRQHLRNLARKGLVTKTVPDQWRLKAPKPASTTWFEEPGTSEGCHTGVPDAVVEGVF